MPIRFGQGESPTARRFASRPIPPPDVIPSAAPVFLNGIMLAGLVGIAVPVILHLLARARYRSVDWGAMMFLVGVNPRQQHSARLRQFILLFLRCAAIALIALAFARPIVSSLFTFITPAGHLDVVIILDNSASMSVRDGETNRIEQARHAAVAIISSLRRGDQVAILPTVGQRERSLSSDLQDAAARVAALEPLPAATDLASSFWEALDVLERGNALNREIYLITDRQELNWRNLSESYLTSIDKRIRKLPSAPRLFMVPIGGQDQPNLAITSFTATNLPAVTGQPVDLEVTVNNYSTALATDVPLTISTDAKPLAHVTANIPAGAAQVLRLATTMPASGARVLTASIDDPLLPFDNQRDLAILVNPPIDVLIVSGDERSTAPVKESTYLRLALAPFATSGETGVDPFVVSVIQSHALQHIDGRKFPLVILANVPSITEAQARELEQFVYSGGGLLISGGNLFQPRSYNDLLYRNGAGILPAELGPAPAERTSAHIATADLKHALFRFLRGQFEPLQPATISRCMATTMPTSDSHALITLSSGQSLLLERSVGRGKVLLFTSSLDAGWNNLPVTSLYLPMLQSIGHYLAALRLPDLNLLQGQTLSLSVVDLDDPRPVVTRPDGRQEPADLRTGTLATEVRFFRTQVPGRYTLEFVAGGQKHTWPFVVNSPIAESDLKSLSPDQLRRRSVRLNMTILFGPQEQLATVVGQHRAGRELFLPLLLLALGVLALESWYSRVSST